MGARKMRCVLQALLMRNQNGLDFGAIRKSNLLFFTPLMAKCHSVCRKWRENMNHAHDPITVNG